MSHADTADQSRARVIAFPLASEAALGHAGDETRTAGNTMRAFLLALPLADNAGKELNGAHATFQKIALSIAGGYTKRPSGEGVWQDPADGRVYYDRMVPYVFACERATFDQVKRLAFDIFADQVALYWEDLGEATIERRPAARMPDRATGADRDKLKAVS